MSESRENTYAEFIAAPALEGARTDERKRGAARWAAAKRLLADREWLGLTATVEQRARLHAYLSTLAATPIGLEARLEALAAGLASGLFTREACRWHLEALRRAIGDNKMNASDLKLLIGWLRLRDRALLNDSAWQALIGRGLCLADQDDRQRLLTLLLVEAPATPVSMDEESAGCLTAAWAYLATVVDAPERTRGESDASDDGDSADEGEGKTAAREQARLERHAKALADLRAIGVPWLIRRQHLPDATAHWRLTRVALALWAPPSKPDSTVAARSLIDERRQTTAALLAVTLGSASGAAALQAVLEEQNVDPGPYQAALDACWAAGLTDLYGRLGRRWLRGAPLMAATICRADLNPRDAIARLLALFDAPDGDDLGQARASLEAVALERATLLPAEERHRALPVLAHLSPSARDDGTRTPASVRSGIYETLLARLGGDDISASMPLTVDADFRFALRDWISQREREAAHAALAEQDDLRAERARLSDAVAQQQAEIARLNRLLDEARVLGQAAHGEDTLAARLPLLNQVIALADQTDRLLVAGEGDYDTLMAVREHLHDILAEQGVQVVGQIGERTRFDADLHEYVGERGAEHEWYVILESGYVIYSSAKSTTVLKRVRVQPAER